MDQKRIVALTEDQRQLCDMYIRLTIRRSAAYSARRQASRDERVRMVDIEAAEDISAVDENIEALSNYILYLEEYNITIPITSEQLYRALKGLTERQQTVFLANMLLRIPYVRIAEVLGISVATAKKHKLSALKKIRGGNQFG